MKTSIIYLGILATMFVNISFANGIDQNQNDDQAKAEFTLESGIENLDILKKPAVESESEINFVNTNSKTIEEVIAEDRKITEYKEEAIQPLIIDKTIEEVIKEDNQIIEGNVTGEVYPLDFELIKKYEN